MPKNCKKKKKKKKKEFFGAKIMKIFKFIGYIWKVLKFSKFLFVLLNFVNKQTEKFTTKKFMRRRCNPRVNQSFLGIKENSRFSIFFFNFLLVFQMQAKNTGPDIRWLTSTLLVNFQLVVIKHIHLNVSFRMIIHKCFHYGLARPSRSPR